MRRRQISHFRAFAFQADFSSPAGAAPSAPPADQRPEADDERVSLPIMEIAALGAQLQAQAAEVARAPVEAALAERLEQAASKLAAATDQLSELAIALDLAARMSQVPPALAPLAERAAKTLADGQGDLFAACQSLAAKS